MRKKRSVWSIFQWRLREAFVKLALIAVATVLSPRAEAVIISGLSFSNNSITYEDNSIPNGTTLSFTLDTPGAVRIDISRVTSFGSTGIQVASINQLYATSGAKTYFWDGLWLFDGARGRFNGLYEFTLTLSTATGSFTLLPTQTVEINSVDIHSVAATPSLDSSGQSTFPYRISYALAKDSRVTARIYNSSDTLVRTMLNDTLQSGELISTHTLSWNGLDDNQQTVGLGIYTIKINAKDPTNGGNAIERQKTLAVTSLEGAIGNPQDNFKENVFVYPNPIRDGEGFFQYQAIRDGATLSLKIYTISGDLVLDKNFGSVPVGVIQRFRWDTTNQAGNRVGRGLYFYVFREEDSQGTLQTTKKLAVIR